MSDYEIAQIEEEVLGASQDTEMYGKAAGELVTTFTSTAAQAQAKKENAAKAKKDKDEADRKAAQYAADAAAAQKARTEATIAQQLAASEANPSGPLHIAAIRADAAARQLEQKLGYGLVPGGYGSYGQPSGGNFLTKKVGPLPVWGWGLVGIAGTTALIYGIKALRR